MASIRRRTVLVTGCSEGGIGYALANAFNGAGLHVFATARDKNRMVSLKDKKNMTLLTLDVTKGEDISAAVQHIKNLTGGKLDFLINNAARNHFMPLADEDMQDVRNLFESNVIGPLAMIKAFTPLLIATRGCVINVSSLSGKFNIPLIGTFAATKSSLDTISATLRLELKPFHVRVISLLTGSVKTNGLSYMTDHKLPAESLYKPIEADIYAFANGSKQPEDLLSAADYVAQILPKLLNERTNGVLNIPDLISIALRFANACFPMWLMDYIWLKVSSMHKLEHIVQKRVP